MGDGHDELRAVAWTTRGVTRVSHPKPGVGSAGRLRAASEKPPEQAEETARAGSAAPLVPDHPTPAALRAASAWCRGCSLYRGATQTVFGEGEIPADVILVGEQPGDREDLAGSPFVGPAGRELDRALAKAGIDRRRVYVTKVV